MDFLERVKILESKTTRKKIQTEIQKCTDSDLKRELELKAHIKFLNDKIKRRDFVIEELKQKLREAKCVNQLNRE